MAADVTTQVCSTGGWAGWLSVCWCGLGSLISLYWSDKYNVWCIPSLCRIRSLHPLSSALCPALLTSSMAGDGGCSALSSPAMKLAEVQTIVFSPLGTAASYSFGPIHLLWSGGRGNKSPPILSYISDNIVLF